MSKEDNIIKVGGFKEKRKEMESKALAKRLDAASKRCPSKSLFRQFHEYEKGSYKT
jgi:hypothetical protein